MAQQAAILPTSNLKTFADSVAGRQDVIADFTASIGPAGDYKYITGFNVLINSIQNLLMTPLGSYPFDPTYGSELYKKVFDPADSTTQEEIIYEIEERVAEFDDRVKISSIDARFFKNNKGFRVNVIIERGNYESDITLDFDENSGFAFEEG